MNGLMKVVVLRGMSNRIYKFDTLKAMAMMVVVVFHAYYMGLPESLLSRVLVINVLGVSMFLFSFISGWMIRPGKWNNVIASIFAIFINRKFNIINRSCNG